ncbi:MULTISPECIES: hypothetical protein [Pseudanabaena]|uniref:hypothetical protein n=1 Tax=Pseudanabaena TaxID=1152 RepID=UPI002479E840|nr:MULTISPECIES: hypothetical protein [Pseudanabaena]MEA5488517.1 hypothetical protein [Pseudanabaena sp. CCNP1317]WGS71917.1 hypothetical protein OA858_19775 [Pseudanabaena galeata CCNP1313]
MTIMLRENPELLSVTSALETIRQEKNYYSRAFIFHSGTTACTVTAEQNLLATVEMTTSGISLPSTTSPEATQKSLSELRRLSGLTWDQLAKLFNVSRRSLHFWASGQPLSSFNEEHLNRLLSTIQYIDRGSASLNRTLLMKPDNNGNLLFDLLIAGQYEKFKQIVGTNNAPQKAQLGSLSRNVYKARMPQNPADLVDALQDPIHREVGEYRIARVARSRKNSSGQ